MAEVSNHIAVRHALVVDGKERLPPQTPWLGAATIGAFVGVSGVTYFALRKWSTLSTGDRIGYAASAGLLSAITLVLKYASHATNIDEYRRIERHTFDEFCSNCQEHYKKVSDPNLTWMSEQLANRPNERLKAYRDAYERSLGLTAGCRKEADPYNYYAGRHFMALNKAKFVDLWRHVNQLEETWHPCYPALWGCYIETYLASPPDTPSYYRPVPSATMMSPTPTEHYPGFGGDYDN